MIERIEPSSYRRARALLDKIATSGDYQSIGIDLAIALGIVIADCGAPQSVFVAEALAPLVIRAAVLYRQTENAVNSCAGSA